MKQEKISIDMDTHRLLKVYCAERDLKMGAYVARLIRERISDERENLRPVQDKIFAKESIK
jgi:hypothetical protein